MTPCPHCLDDHPPTNPQAHWLIDHTNPACHLHLGTAAANRGTPAMIITPIPPTNDPT